MTRSLSVLLIAGGLAAALGIAGLAGAWIWPMYRDMARRSQGAKVYFAAEDVRKEIGYRVAEKKALAGVGKGLSIPAGGSVTSATVSDDGVIVVNGAVDGYPVALAFKPYLRGGEVEWRCRALKRAEGLFIPKDGYLPRGCANAASLDSF